MSKVRCCLSVAAMALLAACQPSSGGREGGITMDEAEVFDAIGPDEVIYLTGTEPFWGGEIAQGQLRYSTPENIEGEVIAVERFAGNNGLAYSGQHSDAPLDVAITPGDCSDAMSDRSYPFVVTLEIGGETRFGCAWTDATPFSGEEAP